MNMIATKGEELFTEFCAKVRNPHYNQAIKLNPKDASAFNNRGNAKFAKGDLNGTVADYNQAIQLNPQYGLAGEVFQIAAQGRTTIVLGQVCHRKRVVITQSPTLNAASSRRSGWREGSRSRPSCGSGRFWSGSKPSRTNKVRRCAMSFTSLSPFSHAVPIRGSG
jgi:tetratricopeptide (TPR) repeat protein